MTLHIGGFNGVFDSNLGKWVYGDKQNSNIGILSDTLFTHYGDMVEWILYTPLFKGESFTVDQLEIETIPGLYNRPRCNGGNIFNL